MPKFSFDLPKLIVSNKSDRTYKSDRTNKSDRTFKQQLRIELESPPQTPRSVRPPLPAEAEAALRGACTHLYHALQQTGSPPVPGPLVVKGVWGEIVPVESQPSWPHQTTSHHGQHHDESLSRCTSHDPAAQRVDALMSQPIVPVVPVVPVRVPARVSVHSPEQTKTSIARANTISTSISISTKRKPVEVRRPSGAPRIESRDTCSASQSDATDERLAASTAMTSAVATPAHQSIQHSRQHSGNELAWNGQRRASEATQTPLNTGNVPRRTVVTRRPVGQEKRKPALEAVSTTQATTPNIEIQTATLPPVQRTATQETTSGNGDERPGRAAIRTQTADSARSLSRRMKDCLKSGSRKSSFHAMEGETAPRKQSISSQVKEFVRPVTSAAMKKPSWDSAKSESGPTQVPAAGHHEATQSKKVNESVGSLAERRTLNLDLNRKLPPLPGLDSWRGESTTPSPKSAASTPLGSTRSKRWSFLRKSPSATLSPRSPGSSSLAALSSHAQGALKSRLSGRSKGSTDPPSPMPGADTTGASDYFGSAQASSPRSESSPMTPKSQTHPTIKSVLSHDDDNNNDNDEDDDGYMTAVSTRTADRSSGSSDHAGGHQRSGNAAPGNSQHQASSELQAFPSKISMDDHRGQRSHKDAHQESAGAQIKLNKSWWTPSMSKKQDWTSDLEPSHSHSTTMYIEETANGAVVKYP